MRITTCITVLFITCTFSCSNSDDDDPGNKAGAKCTANADCNSGFCVAKVCSDGRVGDLCMGTHDCSGGLLCSPLLNCQNGVAGDPCESNAQCGDNAPICNSANGLCAIGASGSSCGVDNDCESGFCVNQICRAGNEGDVCGDNDDCVSSASICSTAGTCQDGNEGDDCMLVTDCASSASICSALGACQDGAAGDPCTTASDCATSASICSSTGICQAGVIGDPCANPGDCDGFACSSTGQCSRGNEGDNCSSPTDCDGATSICSVAGVCQDGSEGDVCGGEADCHSASAICAAGTNTCQDGHEGDSCVTVDDCDTDSVVLCSTAGICQDGGLDDPCVSNADCSNLLCSGASLLCQAGVEGDPCDVSDDCHVVDAPICSTASICQDGNAGDSCGTSDDCHTANPICSSADVCQVGASGDPCTVGDDCVSDQCAGNLCDPNLDVSNQTLELTTAVTIDAVRFATPGWLVLLDDAGGNPDAVIGTVLFAAGAYTNQTVYLGRRGVDAERIHIALRTDAGTLGMFEPMGADTTIPDTVAGGDITGSFVISVPANIADVRFTITNNGASDFRFLSVSPTFFETMVSLSLPALDPVLTLVADWRYEVVNQVAGSHPFELIHIAGGDAVLLSQTSMGSMEGDAGVAWQELSGGVARFTYTNLEELEGYRCGVHTGTMRGLIQE